MECNCAVRSLEEKISKIYTNSNGIYTDTTSSGYWSNLAKDEQEKLLFEARDNSSRLAVERLFPDLVDVIYNPNRSVGLRLLDINASDIGVDYGCMWGNLLVYAARLCAAMVGIDQTEASLRFLQYRLRDEGIANCLLINSNLRRDIELGEVFDFAIVNGVLEWLPDENDVELKRFLKRNKPRFKIPKEDPRKIQLKFLRMLCNNLKENGRLYLAIENRYNYQFFLWKPDPHPNLFYTSFLPRKISNLISNMYYGRPYVNYLYSHKGLEKLLREAGFNHIEKYAVFPNYHYPERIIPFRFIHRSNYQTLPYLMSSRNRLRASFRLIKRITDLLIYNKLKLFAFSPSFIIIAKK